MHTRLDFAFLHGFDIRDEVSGGGREKVDMEVEIAIVIKDMDKDTDTDRGTSTNMVTEIHIP